MATRLPGSLLPISNHPHSNLQLVQFPPALTLSLTLTFRPAKQSAKETADDDDVDGDVNDDADDDDDIRLPDRGEIEESGVR